MSDLQQFLDRYHQQLDKIKNLSNSITTALLDGIENIIKDIQSESNSSEWAECEKNMSVWGSYGWTLPPDAILPEFYEKPASKKSADEYMMPYCTDDSVQYLNEAILDMDMDEVNRKRFSEAVKCYQNGTYTACASVLTGLIDGALGVYCGYNYQNQMYPFGNGARRTIDSRLSDVSYMDKATHMLSNTMSFLRVFFEKADPLNPPDVINRNLLLHGLWPKDVTKIDCIQLMLLYWHVLLLVYDLNNGFVRLKE